jgi:glycosyltransferase involved in cell wall biosynthesis
MIAEAHHGRFLVGLIITTSKADPVQNLSVLYFGNDWYAENRTSSHHIARQLARHMPLLYVDTPGMRPPTASSRDLRKILRIAGKLLARPQQAEPRLWHLTVPQIPYRRLPFVDRLNQALGRWLVRRAARFLHFGRRMSWFTVPHPAAMAGMVGDELVVYYIVDDYAALAQMDAPRIQRLDDALTSRADVVFVCSETLLARKREFNRNVEYSPHGVDFELFSKAQDPATDMAEPARGLRRPVIGYFGSIAGQIDLELIAYLAGQRAHWTFLLIGMASVDVGAIASLPNVHLPGAQPYESLPQWAKAFDVAIVPYRRDRFVMNANPLKIREYLAAGKPVVSVRAPEIERFREVVFLADSEEDFLQKIEQALKSDNTEMRQKRMDAVRNCSWQACAERSLGIVQKAGDGR